MAIYLDLRATGPDPRKDRMLQVTLGGDVEGVIDMRKRDRQELQDVILPLLEDPDVEVVGHDLKSGLAFIRVLAGRRIRMTSLFDTRLTHQLITAGLDISEAIRDLDEVASFYLGEPAEPKSGELESHIVVTLEVLHRKLSELLSRHDLTRAASIEFDAIPSVVEMELAGMVFDGRAARSLLRELVGQRTDVEAKLKSLVEDDPGWNPPERMDASGSFNPRSPRDVKAAIKVCCHLDTESTDRNSLERISTDHTDTELLDSILQLRGLDCRLNSAERFLEFEAGGRICSRYNQIGAATGRLSTREPNIQGVPRSLRYLFTAPPEFKLIECDLRGIELRIAASLSGDENLIRIFQTGGDPHRMTAACVFNKPEDDVTDEERQVAKAVNFGSLYGGSHKALQRQVKGLSEKDANDLLQKFAVAYPGIHRWQQRTPSESVLFNDEYRLSRSKIGRVRFVDVNHRNALLNTPVQATGADIIKRCLAAMYEALCILGIEGVRIVACIHDSIVLESPDDLAVGVSELLRSIMVRCGSEMLDPVPCEAEVKIGTNWSFDALS